MMVVFIKKKVYLTRKQFLPKRSYKTNMHRCYTVLSVKLHRTYIQYDV